MAILYRAIYYIIRIKYKSTKNNQKLNFETIWKKKTFFIPDLLLQY